MHPTTARSSTRMKKLSIIIPVYCNADTLPLLDSELDVLASSLDAMDITLQLIFVDDGSYDDSLAQLLKLKRKRPETTVVKLTRNFGAVSAVKTGFQYVDGDAFMMIAADLQDPVDKIPELAKHWLDGAKYIILVRESRADPISSQAFSAIYYWLVRRIIFRHYPKGGFDVALMDKALLPYMRDSGKNINPSLYSYYLGYDPVVLTYHRNKRAAGKSKWTFVKKFNYFIDSLVGFSIVPLRVMAVIGLLVALASFAYGTTIVVATLIEGSAFPGFPSLASLIAFLSGTTLFVTGLIGEYVWRTFDQVNLRPEAVVEEVF